MKKILAPMLLLLFLLPVSSQTIQIQLAGKFDVSSRDDFISAFSPNETFFFTLDYNRKVTVWNTANRQERYSFTGKYSDADFSPDGRRLAVYSKKAAFIADAETGRIYASFDKYKDEIKFAQFSPDGKWLAFFFKKAVLVANAETGQIHANFDKYKDEIKFLGWNPNGKNFAVGTRNFKVDVLSVETGMLLSSMVIHKKKKLFVSRFFDFADLHPAQFSPDGSKILTHSGDQTAEFWEVETGKLIKTFTLSQASPYNGALPELPDISYVQISPDGKWILTGSYDQNRLWETETGKLVEEFSGYSHPRFSPDSRYLGMVTAPLSKYRATAMFDLSEGKIRNFFPEYFGDFVIWSPDSKTFITDRTVDEVNKEMAYIWDTETGKQQAALKTRAKYCFDFVSTCISDRDVFSFSPNSKILMSQNEKQVKILNPENGETIFILDGAVASAVWSPKGNFVLAKSVEKGKLGLWEITR